MESEQSFISYEHCLECYRGFLKTPEPSDKPKLPPSVEEESWGEWRNIGFDVFLEEKGRTIGTEQCDEFFPLPEKLQRLKYSELSGLQKNDLWSIMIEKAVLKYDRYYPLYAAGYVKHYYLKKELNERDLVQIVGNPSSSVILKQLILTLIKDLPDTHPFCWELAKVYNQFEKGFVELKMQNKELSNAIEDLKREIEELDRIKRNAELYKDRLWAERKRLKAEKEKMAEELAEERAEKKKSKKIVDAICAKYGLNLNEVCSELE